MLIPYNTDAPIYYFPYATIGLIVANVIIYVASATLAAREMNAFVVGIEPFMVSDESTGEMDDESQLSLPEISHLEFDAWQLAPAPTVMWFTLNFDTINPIQWFTHNFMHADVMHLIGNMLFLWAFGLIVEGKLGWWKFLSLYGTICLLQGAFIQLVMFVFGSGEGVALGASGAIYAIMSIAVLWAPKNELSCLLFYRFIPRVVEIPIIGFGGFYLAMQFFFFFLHGFSMSSEALHLSGVLMGLPLGILLLKKDWVDCEGWDYFTVYHAKSDKQEKVRSRGREREQAENARIAKQAVTDERQRVIQSLQAALEAKQPQAAVAIFHKFSANLQNGQKLDQTTLARLIQAMHQVKQWPESMPLLVELLRRLPPEKSVPARLKLAQICIQVTDQPKQGVMVLKKLPAELTAEQLQLRNKLVKSAKLALAEGSMEVDIHDW